MTYVQRFQVPEDLFEIIVRDSGLGGLGYNGTVSIKDTTVDKFSEYRRLWRGLHGAWKDFEPEITLAELARGSVRFSATVENGKITLIKGQGGYRFTSENPHYIPFSSIREELIAMLPKGVTLEVSGSYLVYRGVGVAERVLEHLGRLDHIFRLGGIYNADISPWQLSTLLSRINALNSSWRDGLRAIVRQNREVNPEHLNRHDRAMLATKKDTGKSLESFISKRRVQLRTNDRVIDSLPVAEHGTLSSRRWGIEIELAGARGIEAPEYWERKDDGSLRSAYGARDYIDPEDCEDADHREEVEATLEDGTTMYVENPQYSDPDYCDYCGNIEDEDANWEDTAEIVSPILRSFHSRGLEKLLDDAQDEPQNDSAGTHVHVEAKDLTPKQLGALVYAYEFISPLLEASYQREDRHYCASYQSDELIELNKRVKTGYDPEGYGLGNQLSMGRRYKTVNLMSLDTHGTVEFRAMGPAGGSIDYDFLIKWAHFCREMVNVAKANVPMGAWSAVKTFDDVKAIFAKYGQETSELTLAALDFKPDTVYELVDENITYTTTLDGVRELVEV